MKSPRPFLLLILLLTSALIFGQNQDSMPITVTLKCNIESLSNGSDAYDACRFSDDPERDPREHIIDAKVGQEIIWESEAPIELKMVKHYRGTNVFRMNPVVNNEGKIRAKPYKKTAGKIYFYKLKFKVDGRPYTIDPLIRTDNRDVIPPRQ